MQHAPDDPLNSHMGWNVAFVIAMRNIPVQLWFHKNDQIPQSCFATLQIRFDPTVPRYKRYEVYVDSKDVPFDHMLKFPKIRFVHIDCNTFLSNRLLITVHAQSLINGDTIITHGPEALLEIDDNWKFENDIFIIDPLTDFVLYHVVIEARQCLVFHVIDDILPTIVSYIGVSKPGEIW